MEQYDNNSVGAIQQFDFEDPNEIYSNDDWTVATGKSKNSTKFKDENNKKIPGHHRIKMKVDGNTFRVDFFETGHSPGLKIRNAITGSYYNHRTGTFDEHLYFKVIDTCYAGKNPHFLFYESPEQFERHFFCTVSKDVKKKWLERYNLEIAKRKTDNL
jgi:hypothetical protein